MSQRLPPRWPNKARSRLGNSEKAPQHFFLVEYFHGKNLQKLPKDFQWFKNHVIETIQNMWRQDSFYKLCSRQFRTQNAETYGASYEIAEFLVLDFLQDPLVRSLVVLNATCSQLLPFSVIKWIACLPKSQCQILLLFQPLGKSRTPCQALSRCCNWRRCTTA